MNMAIIYFDSVELECLIIIRRLKEKLLIPKVGLKVGVKSGVVMHDQLNHSYLNPIPMKYHLLTLTPFLANLSPLQAQVAVSDAGRWNKEQVKNERPAVVTPPGHTPMPNLAQCHLMLSSFSMGGIFQNGRAVQKMEMMVQIGR